MFQDALDYPRNADDWVRTLVIGAALSLFSFLFVPVLVLSGYYLRVLRGSMDGEETPPAFEDWRELLVDGVKGFVVAFVYLLLPGVVIAVGVGGAITAAVSGGEPSLTVLLGALFGIGLGAAVFLVVWYVVPAALANVARTGRIGSGFALGELRPLLGSRAYATAWLLGLGALVAAGVVTGVLNVVPLVGFLLALPVTFYASVVAFNLYGRGCAGGFDESVEPPVEPDVTPV
jgi:hypothetical protein